MIKQHECDILLTIRKLEEEINNLKSRVFVLEADSSSINDYMIRLDEHLGEISAHIQNKDL